MTIYFYKVWQPYGCFSNFSPHPVEMNYIFWPTVEHYYQGQKYLGSPRANWEVVKTQIMREAVLKKFLTHGDIREILLSTGSELLVEDSPKDYFWGCGAAKTGKNHLGQILMSVREEHRIQSMKAISQ